MGILIVIAMVWLCVRVAAVLRMVTEVQDEEVRLRHRVDRRFAPTARHDLEDCQDASPPDGSRVGPQDAPWGPQDATPADLHDVASSGRGSDPTSAVAAAIWREVINALGELAACRVPFAEAIRDDGLATDTRDLHSEWLAALRETIIDTVPRPDAGPACLGGRDDAAYLRGWDDAVDWVSQGRDAEPPTWGDIAYMTGWNDAVRQIGRTRRSARAWPTPGESAA